VTAAAHRPAFVLHDHRKPRPHFDLRLEAGRRASLVGAAAGTTGQQPPGPTGHRGARPRPRAPDVCDEHKFIADIGWWEEHDRTERRFVFSLHGVGGRRRYALINTGNGWLLHLTKDQP
jgi:hypothetical protein